MLHRPSRAKISQPRHRPHKWQHWENEPRLHWLETVHLRWRPHKYRGHSMSVARCSQYWGCTNVDLKKYEKNSSIFKGQPTKKEQSCYWIINVPGSTLGFKKKQVVANSCSHMAMMTLLPCGTEFQMAQSLCIMIFWHDIAYLCISRSIVRRSQHFESN